MNILVAEDEAIVGIEIKNTLREMGYPNTELVPSADAIFNKIEVNVPDLIFMDINLEGEKDGIEVTKEIHDQYDVPIVFITAYSSESILERIKTTDALGYIIKPVNEDDIDSITDRVLGDADEVQIDRGDFFSSSLKHFVGFIIISWGKFFAHLKNLKLRSSAYTA